jgi:flagellar biosynthesis protein FlhA
LDPNSPLGRIISNSNILAAAGLLGIVLLLVIPLPPDMLDFLLVFNIGIGFLTLIVSIYIKDPLQFAVFPSILLVATLFRLSLDISAARLILTNGNYTDTTPGHIGFPVPGQPSVGHVIPAIANVMVGGNVVTGLIVFIMLIAAQFIVITQGAERIAQVAARFTLDAMPGKQMAIDADLHAGLIDPETAKQRRKDIEREADFYGAMDGAGKFVKGDAMMAVVVMIVGIIGGLIVGIVFHHMDAMEALRVYVLLVVGNGLSTTLPAVLMSTSMGMVVTRAASESNLGADVLHQLTQQPTALMVAGGASAAMGLIGLTGIFPLPWLPFFILAGLFAGGGYYLSQQSQQQQVVVQQEQKKAAEDATKRPESVVTFMQVDPISVEVGRSLLPLVDPNQGAKLLERVGSIRKHIAMEIGIVLPGVRFRDNLQLKPSAYSIKIKDVEVAQGEVMMNHFLAIGPENQLKNLKGTRTLDPTYGMPGVWIPPEQRGEAERLGCMIFDPISVIATQITEVVRTHGAELLGRQETQALIETVKKTHPAVVKDVIPEMISLGEVQKVLQNLIRERVSIRDLVTILETIGDMIHITKDPDMLTEYVRQALSRVICRDYVNNEGVMHVFTLDPQIEQIISQSIQRTEFGSFLGLDPQTGQEVLQAIGVQVKKLSERGLQPIVLCNPSVRPFVRKLTERSFPNLVVLSYNEIAPKVKIQSAGQVSLNVA